MTVSEARRAARVILLDRDERILLLFGRDPSLADDPGWWFTPGGGVEGLESLRETAIRETNEETGLLLESVNGPVHERDTTFTFEGAVIHQVETYFTASVTAFEINRGGWTELEQRSMSGARWWSLDELVATNETVYPENLVDVLRRVMRR
ncbi:MAG TPA: NUDIX domain-containing protein [Galbitalea sp.]|nr:NUDIX domain-containing protein [Galbitalea sp.]